MSARKRLPNRREHDVVVIEHDGARYTVGIGYINSTAREVFLNSGKPNSMIDTIVSDAAVMLSILLQLDYPIEDIALSLKRNPDGSPSSVLGHVADLIARDSDSLSPAPPSPPPSPTPTPTTSPPPPSNLSGAAELLETS